MNYEQELYHYGVKGMKWGVRKKRAVVDGLVRRAAVGAGVPNSYGGGTKHQLSRAKKDLDILDNGGHLSIGITKKRQAAFDARDRAKLEKKISDLEAKEKAKAEKKEYNNSPEGKAARAEKMKKAAKVGAAVAGTTLAAYGAYKVSRYVKNSRSIEAIKANKDTILMSMQRGGMTAEYGAKRLAAYNDQLAAIYKHRWS